jgi:CheY-like chemotaxis protein
MAKKVLIVDDDPDITKVISFRVKKAGYDTETAQNGQEALDKLKKEKFDLVLLDIKMPVMDGYEFCKIVNADESLKKTPIIVITASVMTSSEDLKEQLKIEYVIQKPIDAENLFKNIDSLIGGP